MIKLKNKKFFCILLCLFLFFPLGAYQKASIRIIGSPWQPGFFEIASHVAVSNQWVYLADMNNSKIQVYNLNLEPLFHFGAYGNQPGSFIEIRGIHASNSILYVASIDSFANKTGRIQAFSEKGLFINEFDKPSQRSDFLRVTELKNKTIAAITERSLCIYSPEGKILSEVQSIENQSFLFLQDITSVSDRGLALIDRAKRGFFVIDQDLKSIQHFGEEHLSIPVAIHFYNRQFIVADASGDLLIFQQNGRFVKKVSTGIYCNGLHSLSSNKILMTSSLRRGLAQIDISTGKMDEALFEPRHPLELHWPESMAINSLGQLYVSDDYHGGMKIISLLDGSFKERSGWLANSETPLKIISLASSLEKPQVFALSRTHLSKIFIFQESAMVGNISYNDTDHFCQLQCDIAGNVYALSCKDNIIRIFDYNGSYIRTLELPEKSHTIKAFHVNSEIHVFFSNGELLTFPANSSSPQRSIELIESQEGSFNQTSAITILNNTLVICMRNLHQIAVYSLDNNQLKELYGHIGGPKAFISKENIQVDIGYQPGLFLFPSQMISYKEALFISDAGNHRIQIIPIAHFLEETVTIILQIGSRKASINEKEIELDAAPFILQQRTMVPLRFIGEAFGAEIIWSAPDQKISISFHDRQIILWVNRLDALINQQEYKLDVAPTILMQRTFVPVRFVSEALLAEVAWEAKDQIITIQRRR